MRFSWVTELTMEITEQEYIGIVSDMRLYVEKMGRSVENAASTVLHNYLQQRNELYRQTIPSFKRTEIIIDLLDRYEGRK